VNSKRIKSSKGGISDESDDDDDSFDYELKENNLFNQHLKEVEQKNLN